MLETKSELSHKSWTYLCPPFLAVTCSEQGLTPERAPWSDQHRPCSRTLSLGLSAEPLQRAAVLTTPLRAAKGTVSHPSLTPPLLLLSSAVSLVT